eukprot:280200-Rhodomonas_salina.1
MTGCSSLDREENPSSRQLGHQQIPVLQPCPTPLVIPDTANNFLRPDNPTTWTSAAELLSNCQTAATIADNSRMSAFPEPAAPDCMLGSRLVAT